MSQDEKNERLVAIRERFYLLTSAKTELVNACTLAQSARDNCKIACSTNVNYNALADKIQRALSRLVDARDQLFDEIVHVAQDLDDAMGVE
jgi:hypothetical protein